MGGVFFDEDSAPCVWHAPFPLEVQELLVTVENPEGDITNSDLEQAGAISRSSRKWSTPAPFMRHIARTGIVLFDPES